MNSGIPILVVDSNPVQLEAVSQSLHNDGFPVLTADSTERGVQLTREQHPGLVLLGSDRLSAADSHRQVQDEASRAGIPVIVFPSSPAAVSNAGKATKGQLELKIGSVEELRAKLEFLVPLRQAIASVSSGPEDQRQLLEILAEGVLFANIEGRLRQANRRAVALLGWTSGKLLEKTVYELASPEDQARLRADVAATLKTGILHCGNYSLLTASGSLSPVELSVSVWRNGHRQPNGLVFLVRDTSEEKRTEKRMHELLEVLNQAQEAVVIRDFAGRIHYANRGAERLFGWSQEELNSGTVRDLFFNDPADFDAAEKELRQHGRWDGELRIRTKTRQSLIIQTRWTRVRGADHDSDYVVAIARDVTEGKRVEESLKEREQLSHTIIETALHGFWMVDLQGRLLDVNDAYCRMSGYTRNELLGMHIRDLEVNEPSRDAVHRHIERIIRKGSDRFETQHRRKDGALLNLEVSATYLDLQRPYLFAFLNDVTERKRLQEEERHFSRQIIEAQEAERSRMGRELHDGVNQIIASAKMRLRKVDERATTLGPALREILTRCDQLLFQALNENRRIAHNLHPSDLHELGLAEACRTLCRDAESRTSMSVKSIVPRRWRKLTPAAELNLFRIAQEGINNVEQHARAKSVQLELRFENDTVVMKITDNGQGFNAKAVTGTRSGRRGAGLANIRERAALLGGTCVVASAPKRGTTITIRVPRLAA